MSIEEDAMMERESKPVGNGREHLGMFLYQFVGTEVPTVQYFLQNIGPYVLRLFPFGRSKLKCNIEQSLPAYVWNECLKDINEYLLETDLKSTHKASLTTNYDDGVKYKIPDLRVARELVCKSYNYQGNAYILPMSMDPEYRFVVAEAIDLAYKDEQLKTPIDCNNLEKFLSLTPNMDYIAQAAEKNKIVQLKDIIDNMNKVYDLYCKCWSDK